MLSKKPLILTVVIAFSVNCPNGHAQESRSPLRFALAVGRALINAPKPFIEVSTKGVYVTGIEEESEAIEWWELQVHSRPASDNGSDSEGSSTSDKSNDNCSNEGDDEANAESDVQYETTTFNPFRVSNETSQYCTTLELKKIKQEPVADNEIAINGTSDESIDNRLNEDESDVQYETTTLNPFRVSNETSQYCTTLELKKIKQEPVADSEILTDSEVGVTKVDAAEYQCDHESCNYSTNRMGNLKRHKRTHLPADQRPRKPKVHQCDHVCCNYSTDHLGNLKSHKQSHLPVDQRPKRPKKPKIHQCDHEGCNYSFERVYSLKRHKKTHLPAGQRPKVHQCDHVCCNFSTDHLGNLKSHKQTHLPVDQRPKRKAYDQRPSNQKRKKGDKE
ncbi:hypothetical protein [Endozoicomonas sp. 4G]|uniref:hypothetical protein n=1 Tax=Endozoicomonas sp. 4G TaxID=2872754 RepID=UPI002078A4D2|nr:hypothetical protein [Endozoicomonas sp. 4G]